MTLLLATVAAILTVHLMWIREAIVIREARWSLYEIRDRLRDLAIEDRRVRGGVVFPKLDEALTTLAPALQFVSLWTVLGAIALGGRRWRTGPTLRELERLVIESGDERLRVLYADMMWVFVETILFRRHPIAKKVLFTVARLVGRTVNLQQAIERGMMVLAEA